MRSYRWQDWTTIRGGVTTVTQGETEWLDLEACPASPHAVRLLARCHSPTPASCLRHVRIEARPAKPVSGRRSSANRKSEVDGLLCSAHLGVHQTGS